MAIAKDQSSIFNFIHFASYASQSSGSYSSTDLINILVTSNQLPTTRDGELNSTVNITLGFNTYYKMQGYNSITQRYEDWHSMGTPLLEPPSGHALLNISIIGTWTDR